MLIQRVGDVHEMVVWILGQGQVVKLCMAKITVTWYFKIKYGKVPKSPFGWIFLIFPPQKVETQWLKCLNADACRRFSTFCTRQSRCSIFSSSIFPLAWLTDFHRLYNHQREEKNNRRSELFSVVIPRVPVLRIRICRIRKIFGPPMSGPTICWTDPGSGSGSFHQQAKN